MLEPLELFASLNLLVVVVCALALVIGIRFGVTKAFGNAIKQLNEAAKHHVQVNAVLALTETLQRDPRLLENLQQYSREVVGAALLHRVNTLGASIQAIEEKLAYHRKRAINYPSTDAHMVARCETLLNKLRGELEAANSAVEVFHALAV